MTHPPNMNGADGRVVVSLEDVPVDLRRKVADEIVLRGGLRGHEALEMQIAAVTPRPCRLKVSEEKAALVRSGRRPLGETPKVWTW